MISVLSPLFFPLLFAGSVLAATAEQWRGRSIYQLIVDRFALSPGTGTTQCDLAAQTWCGGTWNSTRETLDYIQNAGFTAVWISPVSQNYEGPRTVYGDAYHGYWVADVSQLNARFGTSDDLKALSAELHRRNMYLMVDIVVNNVMSTSITPDLSTYLFKSQSQYHTYCPITQWENLTNVQLCWLGDSKVSLPDVNTTDEDVITAYGNWIESLVNDYNIDGLRIDAAKHVQASFWPTFCGKAGVFCIGEVDDSGVNVTAPWQGPQALDSILNYPMYAALTEAFVIPGPQNMSALTATMSQIKQQFKDPGLLGNFIENQDVPRWHNQSVDVQTLYNAMVFNFMSDGIPIVYYGQEQGMSGGDDPYNREALWPSGYAKSPQYQFVTKLNHLRNHLVNSSDWLTSETNVLSSTPNGTAFSKGNVVTVLTNVGSGPQNISIPVHSPYQPQSLTIDVLTCTQFVVSSGGMIEIEYTEGGKPVILIPSESLSGSGICEPSGNDSGRGKTASPGDLLRPATPLVLAMLFFVLGLLGSGV